MEILKFKDYKNKVKGCWWGKYSGGIMGMPFECARGVKDLDWYTQTDLSGIANDDIDLQMVWLRACEKHGNKINSQILAETWLTYITPTISEYGACKANLRMHMPPPLCGSYANPHKHSNGSFIRSEIWACLCPGTPEMAVRYAMEDAMVDHGEEGIYGEVFFAAAQSAAFVEDDMQKIIQIGLKFIPEDSGVAKGVRCAVECYNSGVTWKEARKKILQTVPSSFGLMSGYIWETLPEKDVPGGENGYDAPANVAISVMSLLYGEKDFLKTICIAAGCMEDSDCTAGNAGSTLGILLGYDNIPADVLAPLEDKIAICCIKIDGDAQVPPTVNSLIDRVLRLTPLFLGREIVDIFDEGGYSIKVKLDGHDLLRPYIVDQYHAPFFEALLERIPTGARYTNILLDTTVFYENGSEITEGETKKIKLRFWNMVQDQQWLSFEWLLPSGVQMEGCKKKTLFLPQKHGGEIYASNFNSAEIEFDLTLLETTEASINLTLKIESVGRYTMTYIPINFVKK